VISLQKPYEISHRIDCEDLFVDKKIMIIAPHPDDEVIGCGAFLMLASRVGIFNRSNRFIVCATSGASGVSDEYLYSMEQQKDGSQNEEVRELKNKIRENEARKCAAVLGAQPLFFRLPFYHSGDFGEKNSEEIAMFLRNVEPDIVITIDEEGDPHGTHGMVRRFVRQGLKKTDYSGLLFGYKVWSRGYILGEGDVIIGFDEEIMQEKRKLLNLYTSQILFPAFPHESKSFLQLMEDSNRELSATFRSLYPYAEVFKRLKL
jgi:LmbE family N-acetylglucosaminyl deacetylase